MYLYTTVQVSGHVFVYYGSSEWSCISVLKVFAVVVDFSIGFWNYSDSVVFFFILSAIMFSLYVQ